MTTTSLTTRGRAADALFAIASGAVSTFDTEAVAPYGALDVRDGEALQLAVIQRWQDAGLAPGGWKIAWTSQSARDSGGVGYRPFGYILGQRIFSSGSQLRLADVPWCAVEPEICLVIGSELGGSQVTREQAQAAVSGVAPSFEICSMRLPGGLGRAVQVGDSMGNWGLVVGDPQSPDLALDALSVEVRLDGELVGSSTTGPAVLDDPFLSLARVCAIFDSHGLVLRPGDRVITGAVTPRVPITEPGTVVASFGALGTVSLTMSGQ